MQDFTKNISKIMDQNSTFIFEVSYLADVIKNSFLIQFIMNICHIIRFYL